MNNKKIAIIGGDVGGLILAWLCSISGARVDVYEERENMRSLPGALREVEEPGSWFFPKFQPDIASLYNYLQLYSEPRSFDYSYYGVPQYKETGSLLRSTQHISSSPFNLLRLKKDMRNLTKRINRDRRFQNTLLSSISLKQYLQGSDISSKSRSELFPAVFGGLLQYPVQDVAGWPAKKCLNLLCAINAPDSMFCLYDSVAMLRQKLIFNGSFNLLNCAVTKVNRTEDSVILFTGPRKNSLYDIVISTCNLKRLRSLITDFSVEESTLLCKMHYTDMPVKIHTDEAALPDRNASGISIEGHEIKQEMHFAYHYHLKYLQNTNERIFLSLNCLTPPDPKKVIWTGCWSRPAGDITTLQSMSELHSIQGKGGLWHAGNYVNYQTSPFNGKILAALQTARALNLRLPFA